MALQCFVIYKTLFVSHNKSSSGVFQGNYLQMKAE